jgi:aminopeptidase-like protein
MTGLLKEFCGKDLEQAGQQMHEFASELYPICRSITGNGLRQTLAMIQERIPLSITEVPSGTAVFDWTVPKEWNIRDAYVKDKRGNRVIDFRKHNLHVVNYSVPVSGTFSIDELRPHLHTLPEHPDWIPYRTSYYKPDWGFCLTQNQLDTLNEAEYEVCIDASLEDGRLTYGEAYLPGKVEEEVIVSCHACHPSLANDNLSSIVVAAALAAMLREQDRHFSWRFIFAPGTVGAITWLARNREHTKNVRHGLVLAGIGDSGSFHYKKSRRGDAEIDRAVAHALKHSGEKSEILEFTPYGYDERQYGSPGFNLPVGCLMRSVWGTFPEYHTSADNLSFIQPGQLEKSLRACIGIAEIVEKNRTYRNLSPYCEPQLGKRNLYRSTGGESIGTEINARLWVLNQSDGNSSLLDIADRAGMKFTAIREAADVLLESGLLEEVTR